MMMDSAHDERHEPHVVAEPPQRGAKPPQARIAPAAVVARCVVDADEVSARRADDRPGSLPLQHSGQNNTRTFAHFPPRPARRLVLGPPLLTIMRSRRLTPQMHPDDVAAVARAKGGDEDAFRVLVDRHGRDVYRLAYRMTGQRQDAEDVVQETFVKAYRQLGRFEARSNFATWLYRIGFNCAIDFMRARPHRESPKRRSRWWSSRSASRQPATDDLVYAREIGAKVQRAMTDLSAQERAAFLMRHLLRLFDQ